MGDFKTLFEDSVDGGLLPTYEERSIYPSFVYDTVEKFLYIPRNIEQIRRGEIEYYVLDRNSDMYGKKILDSNWFSETDMYSLYQTKYGLVAILETENGYTVYQCKDKHVLTQIPQAVYSYAIHDLNGYVSHLKFIGDSIFYLDMNTLQRMDVLPEDKRLNERQVYENVLVYNDAKWKIRDRLLIYTSTTERKTYPLLPNVQHSAVILRSVPRYLLINKGLQIDLYDGQTGEPLVKNGVNVQIPIGPNSHVEGSYYGFSVYTLENVTVHDFDGNKLCQFENVRIPCIDFDNEGEEDFKTDISPETIVIFENGLYYILLLYMTVPFMKLRDEYWGEFEEVDEEFFSRGDFPMVNRNNQGEVVLKKNVPQKDMFEYKFLFDNDMLEGSYRTMYTCYVLNS